jgi:hypothetical protein
MAVHVQAAIEALTASGANVLIRMLLQLHCDTQISEYTEYTKSCFGNHVHSASADNLCLVSTTANTNTRHFCSTGMH